MAYDFHGKWERETGHNAPLYAPSSDSEWRKQLSVEHAASMWVKLGAPKDKLVIGMPTYGRTFTLTNSANFKVNAPASGGGKAGDYTKEGGFLAYYEVSRNADKLNHSRACHVGRVKHISTGARLATDGERKSAWCRYNSVTIMITIIIMIRKASEGIICELIHRVDQGIFYFQGISELCNMCRCNFS